MAMLTVNAQQAYESTAQLDRNTSGPCVSIQVKVNAKDAQKIMELLFKTEGLSKGKSSGKKIAYEAPILFSTISQKYICLFVSFDETSKDKNAPSTTVNFFVKKGPEAPFETSHSDPKLIVNIKNFLDQRYNAAVYAFDIAVKTELKQKELEQTEKELENLQKRVDSRTKDIANYEKDIEKAKANIEKAKSDIETAKTSIENQKAVLARQQEELSLIK
jgi:hypothetical protein